MSEHGSRRNTESVPESVIEVVQIDGLVVMKLIKHCHEVALGNLGIAQGALLGLVADTRLEITHSFPFPSQGEESVDDEDFQLGMMRRLRMVNVDHLHVGWYQSANFGNFLSPQLLESHFAYQTSIEESVCLIFDTAKNNRGILSLKALRLTPMAIKLYSEGEFDAESIKNCKLTHDVLFEEVPIIIRNSHLVNELLLELSEQLPVARKPYLDLSCASILEEQLTFLTRTVDEINQESNKLYNYLRTATRQCQEKTFYLRKREQENKARLAGGEEALPDEDLQKIFKAIPPPSRLNALVLAGQTLSSADNVSQFCTQSLAKWFVTEALQKAKVDDNQA